MAYQSIGLGTTANDGSGDTLRDGATKINANFVEVYTALGDGSSLTTGISATADDVTFTGADYNVVWDKSASALEFADNAKAVFGAGSDLEISHNGAYSLIKDGGAGNLVIAAGDLQITNPGVTENLLRAYENGAVELYHDNSVKVTTTSSGISVIGTATMSGNVVIANAGTIGSASDTDAIAIASDGVVTFSQAPVFPDGSIAVADLDIDGATDIGAAITDADLIIVDDGAGGTNRKATMSRLKTYMGVSEGALALTSLDIDGGTDIGGSIADADLFIIDDGAGGTNRKTAASRIKTYIADVTLTTAAQTNITSVGTLTSLTVDNIIINGTNIGHTSDTDAIAIASDGKTTFSQQTTHSGGIVIANAGNIGSASDTDAIAIASDGQVTLSQNLTVSGTVTATAGSTLLVVNSSGTTLKTVKGLS